MVAEVDQDDVTVVIRAELEPALARSLEEATALRAEAEVKEARALSLRRAIAVSLKDDGLTLRDIAVVLGVSCQRVHQLVHEGEPAALAAS
ncbi:sigma factor-like helix-turn-helix DNA-binding protein [Curtobacterium sp. MCLR17_055]|uniref:sigma factor-like helix-turn-helix DNA-binding protein n=1 Tax=Curtobacterium sp. MCLR17_055 TaxID=2175633 RepID=UPI001C64F4E4|nr:sigma factor-like helix-turn-helix DNA-binding protein [Curtobacterium sp. MCLR17_055]